MKGYLTPRTMLKLDELFKEMDWEIDDQNDAKKSLYRRYFDRLKLLSEEEQQIFIDLSYRFEQIGIVQYLEQFLMSFHNIKDQKLSSVDKIIFSPLSKPYVENNKGKKKVERPKTKSTQFLFYYLDAQDLRWIDYSSKFEFLESISDIKKQFLDGSTLLILIDDFVGTGRTAVNCIKNIVSEIRVNKDIQYSDICVVSIAALSEGINKVKDDLKITVYSDIIRKKGISDYYSSDIKDEKINLMLNIENKLKCPKEYSLGFGKSEALISFMNKTPNNTFPAFWHETNSKIAPFPRYKNFK